MPRKTRTPVDTPPPAAEAPPPAPDAPVEPPAATAPPPVPTPVDFRWTPLAEVKAWDLNPRDNTDAVPKVAASIREFGFVAPIVVWTSRGQIVAGHTRLAALGSILAADPAFVPKGAPAGTPPGFAPVRFHEFDDDASAAAYAVADNRLNEVARWDATKLTAVLASLPAPKLTVTGFDASMLAGLAAPPPPVPPPASSPPSAPPSESAAGPTRDKFASVVHYDIIFDSVEQQEMWYDFLKALKERYSRDGTVAARLLAYIAEHPVKEG